MTNQELAILYERDMHKLIAELELFTTEEKLWEVHGAIKNSCGNLALHIIGNLNFHIGTVLAKTGYVRDREREFAAKNISRSSLTAQLRDLVPMVINTISALPEEALHSPHPIFFDKEHASTGYVLTQLLLHLNYHTGQVNYLRRMIDVNTTLTERQ